MDGYYCLMFSCVSQGFTFTLGRCAKSVLNSFYTLFFIRTISLEHRGSIQIILCKISKNYEFEHRNLPNQNFDKEEHFKHASSENLRN